MLSFCPRIPACESRPDAWGWSVPTGLTIWRAFPLPPWRPLVTRGHGPGGLPLGALPAGPALPPALAARCRSVSLGVARLPLSVALLCGPTSLFGFFTPPSPRTRSSVPARLPAHPPPPPPGSLSVFLTCISNYFSLSLSCLPYLKLTSPLPLPVRGSLLKVLETFTR